jgi:hypothetical protein
MAVAFLVSGSVLPVLCQTCPSPLGNTYPSVPFQVTKTLAAFAPQQGSAPLKLNGDRLLYVPAERYAVIESVAIKGTQPAGTYLAIELQTALRTMALTGPAAGRFGNAISSRHFLHTRQTGSEAAPLHVREATKILADAGSTVVIGLQSTNASTIEPMTVTISGVLRDVCTWGK